MELRIVSQDGRYDVPYSMGLEIIEGSQIYRIFTLVPQENPPFLAEYATREEADAALKGARDAYRELLYYENHGSRDMDSMPAVFYQMPLSRTGRSSEYTLFNLQVGTKNEKQEKTYLISVSDVALATATAEKERQKYIVDYDNYHADEYTNAVEKAWKGAGIIFSQPVPTNMQIDLS